MRSGEHATHMVRALPVTWRIEGRRQRPVGHLARWNAQDHSRERLWACVRMLRSRLGSEQGSRGWDDASAQGRCPRAARIAQRFRIVQEVNNLRVLDYANREERRLTQEERRTLIDYLCDAKERTFEQLRKKLDLPETARFNLQRGGRKKLQGHQTDAALAGKNGVGKRWKKLPDETKDTVVEILIHEDREDVALGRLTDECGLDLGEAQRASRVHLVDGYMSFSRVAMQKLLPHLERGLVLMADDETNSALPATCFLAHGTLLCSSV